MSIQLTDEQFEEYMKALNADRRQKHDPASTTFTGSQLHGVFPPGVPGFPPFTAPGVRPEMWGAMVRPSTVQSILGDPLTAETENEIVEVLTGVTEEDSCTNVTDWCGDPPDITGNIKTCQQVIPFGKFLGKTKVVRVPEVGKLRNRADMERVLLSNPIHQHPLIPDLFYRLDNTRSQYQTTLWKFGQGFELDFERVLMEGNSATASTQTECGWWTEFDGFDQIVTTGYQDAIAGVECPAVDSKVVSWNNIYTGTNAAGETLDVVWGKMMYFLETHALRTGNAPTSFVNIMRSQMFRYIAQLIACTFATSGCVTNTTPGNNDIDRQVFRSTFEAQMAGQYLIANSGKRYPVVFSDGITTTRPSDDILVSDWYVVPVTSQGRRVLWYEYFPQDNQFQVEFEEGVGRPSRTMNNGMWKMYHRDNGPCVELIFAQQGRLRLDVPFLAGRIDGIRYTFDDLTPQSPYADETFMYRDGGQTFRDGAFASGV